MEWAAWAPTDAAIRAEFGHTPEADRAAADVLRSLVPAARWRDVRAAVRNRSDLVVVGCGPSLERLQGQHLANRTVVACDGACTRLRELGVAPSLVVTDLDGEPEGLRWAAACGAFLLVHAHGDNVPALRALVPTLGPLVHGTHATEPDPALEPLRSWGGFTDGDRAVVALEELGARHATLVAFEFDAPPSRYSHRWDPDTKPRKLAWAQRIVSDAAARGKLSLAQWTPP